jgi:predicted CXXCH cytochrome family protein
MKKGTIFITLLLFTALISISLMSKSTVAQEAKPQNDSCITSKCHGDINKQKYLHGPISQGQCIICHKASPKHKDNPKKYKFKEIADIAAKCYECHEQFPPKKAMHAPVEEGECLACHNPHGSPNKFQLVSKGGKLCFDCHDEEIMEGNFVHGPAAVGGCIACHEPHTADFSKNLRANPPELCYMCHEDKAEVIHKAEFVHKPVSEDCTKCHNPHSAEKKFMLQSEAPVLCLTCHKDKKDYLAKIAVKHGALDVNRSCLNCHDPHNSNIASILALAPMDLCMSCHDKEYKRKKGKPVTNIQKWLAENTDHHGPIKQQDCSGCHNPHGSENFRILRNPYPPNFYKPFAVENYNLCFGCHEKTLVLNPETTRLTNFRNGNMNLHFVHVNKPIKGRTCRACHETHASNFPKHIRESVPFGSWELPVNYEKTESGGSCMPGCHKLKSYDRIKRVTNG